MRLRDIWPWLKAEYRWRVLGETYEIRMTEECKRQFDALPEEVQRRIAEEMERIARNPYKSKQVEINKKDYGYHYLEIEGENNDDT